MRDRARGVQHERIPDNGEHVIAVYQLVRRGQRTSRCGAGVGDNVVDVESLLGGDSDSGLDPGGRARVDCLPETGQIGQNPDRLRRISATG